TRVKSYLGSEKRRDPAGPADWFRAPPGDRERIRLVIVSDDGIEIDEQTDPVRMETISFAKNRPDLLGPALELAQQSRAPWIASKDRTLDGGLAERLAGRRDHGTVAADLQPLYERTVSVVPVDVLRRGSRRIGHGLCWENLALRCVEAV